MMLIAYEDDLLYLDGTTVNIALSMRNCRQKPFRVLFVDTANPAIGTHTTVSRAVVSKALNTTKLSTGQT